MSPKGSAHTFTLLRNFHMLQNTDLLRQKTFYKSHTCTCRYQNYALLVKGKKQAKCLKVPWSVPAPTLSIFVNSISYNLDWLLI